MYLHSDLASEIKNFSGREATGDIDEIREERDGCLVTETILPENSAQALLKPPGKYVLIEPQTKIENDSRAFIKSISTEIRKMLPVGPVLVAGLGNRAITPDALGPLAADKILATRHVKTVLQKTLMVNEVRNVSVISPGVMGSTGIEAADAVIALARKIRPACVVAIDALVSRNISHLCHSVQITDTGIAPGSGIGNRRMPLCKDTAKVPVIAVGVPTVIDGETFAYDLLLQETSGEALRKKEKKDNLILTLKDIDMKMSLISFIVAQGINTALNPEISEEEFSLLTQY